MKYIFVIIIVGIIIYFIGKNKQKNKPSEKPKTLPKQKVIKEIKEDEELSKLKKKYPLWYSSENTIGICYKNKNSLKISDSEEIVYYKSDRYAQLFGRGAHCSYFPGYGKIYNRIFEVWYQNVGEKEKLGIQTYSDIGIERNQPFFADEITNGIIISNELERTKGFLKLWNARDQKNNKNWYAGLKDLEYTNIITEREAE